MRIGGAFLPLLMAATVPVLADVEIGQLQADQAALDAARADFRQRADRLSAAETADYTAFIARLERRLAQGCEALRERRAQPPAGVTCPSAADAPVSIDLGREHTREERTRALDAELGAGLGAFDERLLREQARVRAGAPRRGDGEGAGTGEGMGKGDAGEGANGAVASGEAGPPAGVGREREATQSSAPPPSASGSPGKRGLPTVPADIPDGSDDDVVARQIREAAEAETDPALREKLWDEYRRYKRGNR